MKYLKRFNESFDKFDDEGYDDDIEGIKFDDEGHDDDIEGIKFDDEDEDDEDCYAMAYDKIDKMLPADSELQKEFYEIIDSEEAITIKYSDMEEFFVNYIDEGRFDSYCRNGNLKDFAIYVVQKELKIEEE